MLVTGRQEYFASSVVKDAPILPGLGLGQLQITHALESSPTATIAIIGIPERELTAIRAAYELGTQYRLFGMDYTVVSYEDRRAGFPCPTRQHYGLDQEYEIDVELEGIWEYPFNRNVLRKPLTAPRKQGDDEGVISVRALANTVGVPYIGPDLQFLTELKPDRYATINLSEVLPETARLNGGYLNFANANGIEIKGLESGRTWTFIEKQVLDEGSEIEQYRPGYNWTEVTGDFSQSDNEDDDDPPDFVAVEPVQQELIEMDDDPQIPPPDTVVLRDLTSNADFSGPTKQWRRSITLNGAPVLDESKIYGFAYTGRDIHVGDGVMFSSSPKSFWKVVDYQKTTYEYDKLNAFGIPIRVTDPETGEVIPIYRDPDSPSSDTVTVTGGGVRINPKSEYLTEEVITGFQKTRFEQEPLESGIPQSIFYDLEPDRFDDPVEAAKFQLWQFFDNPLTGTRNYELRTERSHYVEGIANAIDVSVENVENLDPRKAAKLTIGSRSRSGLIALARPAQNYVESMLVFAEGENQWSFRFTPHPENTPDDPTKPPYIVGKEVLNRTFRNILIPSEGRKLSRGQAEKYEEKTKEYTAQDPGYDQSLEMYRTKEIAGRPPQATTRSFTYEQREESSRRDKKPVYRYFMVSDQLHERVEYGGSRSYPNARFLSQALTAAWVDLILDDVNARSRNKSFTWSYPDVKAGDFCVLRDQRHLITRVSTTYEYEGSNNPLASDKPLTVSRKGLEVEMGLFENRTINSNKVPDERANAQGGGASTELSVGGGGSLGSLGSVSVNLQTRRKY